MRRWRVGNLSSGVMFIILGIVLLASLLKGLVVTEYIFKFWPVVLIILGLEIIAYVYFSKADNSKVKYDILSIFMIILVGLFSIGAYTIYSLDIMSKLSSSINRQEYSTLIEDQEINIDKDIKKVIVDYPTQYTYASLDVKEGINNKIIVSGKGTVLANSKEESQSIINNSKIKSRKVGDNLYIEFENVERAENLNPGVTWVGHTIFLPGNKNIEIQAHNQNINIDGDAVKNKWVVRNSSDVDINIDVDDSLDIFATVVNSNGLKGSVEWNKNNELQDEESGNSYTKGNVKFKEGLNKIYIIECEDVKVNTLY
ncbi:LiaF transmembrane domain-containing protein [Tepidibacter hydrothermalis]|uniref:LiaF transmembrane domain-containing protein n=1 Tax=Tepidibacter hydrothermalis TaxID=3036126 RepID=A0ABY8EEX7_9FIRM|nr:hypothetical protein [Tepidibacter hydrothermalis]WFD11492.1 hypothetical protein P4S50_05300 [Tepidibacter hydrothermalis]